jgi:hypothetical protein
MDPKSCLCSILYLSYASKIEQPTESDIYDMIFVFPDMIFVFPIYWDQKKNTILSIDI